MATQSSNSLRRLIKSGERKVLSKGDVFQASDEEPVLNIVQSGYIERYRMNKDGVRGVQSIYGTGDFFPLTPVFKLLFNQDIYEGPETYYYSAASDAVIYSLDAKSFVKGVKQDPALLNDLLFESGKRLQSNIERLESISLPNSYQRVAHYLARLARRSGKQMPRGVLIPLPVTQKDIVENLGLQRGTVAKAVRTLRKEGLISGRGNIIVLHLDKLEARAYE